MAFYGVSSSASNIPLSAVSGAGGLFAFATSGTPTLYKGAGGAPILVGVPGDARSAIPATSTAQQLTFDKVRALEAAAYYSGGFTAGVAGPLQWNAGAGSSANISEAVRYKVTSATGGSLTCVGPHPQRVPFVVSIPNPAWPATGEPKWISSTVYGSIPIGAEVRPLPPSVLASKINGVITAISASATYAEETTVTFATTGDFDNITAPLDAAVGEFEAFVDVYFYRTAAPLPAPLAFAPNQHAWAFQTRSKTRVEVPTLDGDGCFELTGPGGVSDRLALSPDFDAALAYTGAAVRLIYRTLAGAWVEVDDVASRWRPQYAAGVHTSRIYLADLYAITGTAALASFVVAYWSEYRVGDDSADAGDGTLRHPRACINSRPFTGYANAGGSDTGQACWAMEYASGFADGDFHADCHLPLCDNFAVRTLDGTASGETIADPGHYASGGNLWDRLTVAPDITLVEQFTPGSPAASLYVERTAQGQPSLAWLGGAWYPIDRGLFTIREPLVGPLFGRRKTYTDDDGNEGHTIAHGAFWQRAWSDTEEVQDSFDASDFTSAEKGVFSAAVDYSTRTPPTGVAYPAAVDGVDEYLPPHCGGVNQYTGDIVAADPGNRLIAVSSSVKWSLSFTTDSTEDATLAAEIDSYLVGL